jgi:hypothetical protein
MRARIEIRSADAVARTVRITDLDGSVSVTNDAEAVVRFVNARYPGHRIFYRDTMGNWDELVHANGIFTGFAPGTDSED